MMPDANVQDDHTHEIVIKIGRETFKITEERLTGAQLRALPAPPIGPDRDLYLEVPGPTDDRLISDGETVELKSGMHFFTTPSSINAGGHARSA